jgi:hypothetical protein
VTDEIRKLNILSKPNCYPLKNLFESFRLDYSLLTLISHNRKVVVLYYPQVFFSFTNIVSCLQLSIKKGIDHIKTRQEKFVLNPKKTSCKRLFSHIIKKNSRVACLKLYEVPFPDWDQAGELPVEKMIDFVNKLLHPQPLQLKSLKYLKSLFTKTPIC